MDDVNKPGTPDDQYGIVRVGQRWRAWNGIEVEVTGFPDPLRVEFRNVTPPETSPTGPLPACHGATGWTDLADLTDNYELCG